MENTKLRTWETQENAQMINRPTTKLTGETLQEAIEGREEQLLRIVKPSNELLIKILGTSIKWDNGIFGGKGGAVLVIEARVSTPYEKETPNYREYITTYEVWIHADKEDLPQNEVKTIKELRTLADMTQKEFAEYFNLSQRTLENWECRRTTPPNYFAELAEYKLKKEGIIK